MAVNRGKDFEKAFHKAFEKDGFCIDRFLDPAAGYAGIRNICDFIVFETPYLYYFECKSVNFNSLNFKANITQNQWDGLLEKSSRKAVFAGVVIWFIPNDLTFFVSIQELQRLKKEGRKSIKVEDFIKGDVKHVLFPGIKKRVFFEYDAKAFMQSLKDLIQRGDVNGR